VGRNGYASADSVFDKLNNISGFIAKQLIDKIQNKFPYESRATGRSALESQSCAWKMISIRTPIMI